MTTPGDNFNHPVQLTGTDTTRVRRGQAGQSLMLFPAGMRLVRGGSYTDIPWSDIDRLELHPMSRWSTAKAWAIISRRGTVVFPHEFDERWTVGPIGWWLHRFRPDLPLPAANSLAPLPMGIPNHQIPWVVLPGLVIGIVVMALTTGVSIVSAVVTVVACLAVILLMVISPRWARATRYGMYGLIAVIVLVSYAAPLLL